MSKELRWGHDGDTRHYHVFDEKGRIAGLHGSGSQLPLHEEIKCANSWTRASRRREMTNSDYIMTCPDCDTDVMVEDSPDAPDVSCGCQKGHGPMMDVLKVVGRNE